MQNYSFVKNIASGKSTVSATKLQKGLYNVKKIASYIFVGWHLIENERMHEHAHCLRLSAKFLFSHAKSIFGANCGEIIIKLALRKKLRKNQEQL